MVNARIMYFRPGNLFKDFIIEDNQQKVTGTGRVATVHKGDGSKMLKGCLAEATDEDRANHNTAEHVVTHTIVQNGPPKAKRTDKLILGGRVFLIVDIDDAGTLGIATIYYAEERRDVT